MKTTIPTLAWIDHSDVSRSAELNAYHGSRAIYLIRSSRGSSAWVCERAGQVIFQIQSGGLFVTTYLDSTAFLNALGEARAGKTSLVPSIIPQPNGGQAHCRVSERGLCFEGRNLAPFGILSSGEFPIQKFDRLFLDSFSVIENSEPRLRTWRDISVGSAELALISLIRTSPQIVQSFTPREFEVFVGAVLADCGFSRVQLSRFVKDGGYDLYAIYGEGDTACAVVIEVKHYTSRKVGIEIVDRLNGVRDRESTDRAIIFTASSFTTEVRRRYGARSSRISLIDFERLVELISMDNRWKRTPSALWTLPRAEPGEEIGLHIEPPNKGGRAAV